MDVPHLHLTLRIVKELRRYFDRGRYLEHPPLALSHLSLYEGRDGRFWYKETANGQRRDVALSALDFISLSVKHIPPIGMQLMSHAGLYARNTNPKWAVKVRLA